MLVFYKGRWFLRLAVQETTTSVSVGPSLNTFISSTLASILELHRLGVPSLTLLFLLFDFGQITEVL